MGRIILLVAVGGAIGCVARYLLTIYYGKLFPSIFPYSTFIINVLGSLLIGVFFALSERFNLTIEWRIFLTTGLCGGFTSFSTFTYENIKLLQTNQYIAFATYSIGSFISGLIAVLLGIYLVKVLVP